MHSKSFWLAGTIASCLTLSPAAQAQEKLQVQAVLDPKAPVVDSVKRECGLDAMVGDWVFESVNKKYSATKLAKDAKPGSGKLLKVTIVNVMGVGGGAYSGPKGMTVRAELMQSGKVIATTTKDRASGGGAFAGMKGTCAIFGRVAKALGADVAAWLPGAMKGN